MVQLSHPHMTTEKTLALTIWTFVNKVMSLLFNTLSRFVIAFFPRSKHFLIPRLLSPSAVILEHKKTKSVTVSIVSPSICPYKLRCHASQFFEYWVSSHLFDWQEHWSVLPFPSLEIFLTHISCTASRFFTTEPSGKPYKYMHTQIYVCINIHTHILFHCDLL